MTLSSLLHRVLQKGERESSERARMGRLESDGSYTFAVPGRPSDVYVTLIANDESTTVDAVEQRGGLQIGGFPVRIQTDAYGARYVSGPDGAAAQRFLGERSTAGAHAPNHGDTHALTGGDPVIVEAGQILPGLVIIVSGTTVRVGMFNTDGSDLLPTPYLYNGQVQVLPVTELDWAADAAAITSGMRAWLAIVIDPAANDLDALVGDEYAIGLVLLSKALVADIDFTGVLPLTAFEVRSGQTSAPTQDKVFDLRPFAGALWTATGMTSFAAAGDSGTPQTITDGNTLTIAGGTGIDTVASGTDTITVSLETEAVQDIVAALIVAGANITSIYNDGAGTLTIAVSGLTSTQISDFTEAAQDVVGALLSAGGSGLVVTYNDGANTLVISFSNQSANMVLAGPSSGSAATPAFRALVMDDMPAIVSQDVVPGGRLTPSGSAVVPTSDVTNVQIITYTPYRHSVISIYDGSKWTPYTYAVISIKLTDAQSGTRTSGNGIITGLTDTSQLIVGMEASGTGIGVAAVISSIDSATQVTLSVNSASSGTATVTFKVPASTMLDIFIIPNGGTPALRMAKWTNDTTRATNLGRQNGIVVKSTDTTQLYLGSVRTTATAGLSEDSDDRRFIWNYYNRVMRRCMVNDTTSHTYNSTTIRAWENNVTKVNRFETIVGIVEDAINLSINGRVDANNNTAFIAIGQNSTTVQIETGNMGGNDATAAIIAALPVVILPSLGYSFYQALERAHAGVATFSNYRLYGFFNA